MNATVIIIELTSDRSGFGTLRVEDGVGKCLLGPWVVAFSSNTVELMKPLVGHGTGHKQLVREFLVDGIVPISEGNETDAKQFGRYGIIRLRPLRDPQSSHSEEAGFDECYIYGGELSFDSLSAVPSGSFRLRPEHHRSLVKALKTFPLPVSCRFTGGHIPRSMEGSVAASSALESARSIAIRVASLAATAAVIVSPFLIFSTKGEAQCCISGNSYSAVDFIQLAALEGGNQYQGHVPNEQSGVNIAAGLDLGTHTQQDLTDMGFNQDQIRIVKPYLAPSHSEPVLGFRARNILAVNPLSITSEQADEINNLVFSWHANYVGSRFNQEIQKQGVLQGVTFSKLPSRLQTAMTNMFIVDKGFVESEPFAHFARGQWSAGVMAFAEYPTSKPAVRARARAAGTSLAELLNKPSALPQYGKSTG